MESNAVRYSVTRLTVLVGSTLPEFQSRFEETVPAFPIERVAEVIRRQGPWQDMVDLINIASTVGFFIFSTNDVTPTVRLAGDQTAGVGYLMGNPVIMESMYRHDPAIVLYAPLHIGIWGKPDAPGYIGFDRPSDQFASFENDEIAKVGFVLNRKLADLLERLGVTAPEELLTS
jgi:hypothetical protein